MLLLRLCGDEGALIRLKLNREKSLKLKLAPFARQGLHSRRERAHADGSIKAAEQEHVPGPRRGSN
jgi:hypothetical protein